MTFLRHRRRSSHGAAIDQRNRQRAEHCQPGLEKETNLFTTRNGNFANGSKTILTGLNLSESYLSQEPCPDYVVKSRSGEELRVEAELFATNFIAHRHDPKKVDRIVACFAQESQIMGVPVLAANDLREYEPAGIMPKPAGDLTPIESQVLSVVMSTGGIELSALAQMGFPGD